MCGFVGFYSKAIENKEKVVQEMGDLIRHRGPDSEGNYTDDVIAMGFRRLSILDLKEGGQPMRSADGNLVITFNGEIYNYKEIKEELIQKGYQFRTTADTEVLLYGFQEYGKEILQKLRGMFAFVIWNKETKVLFGARDHFGIKPFYYAPIGEELLFGSEIKSFLRFPHFKKRVNEEALKQYLVFQYPVLNETFFKGVFKLRPGHYFTYQNGEMKIEKYFQISYDFKNRTLEENIERVQQHVAESVEYHRHADVEVGAFLSGGVDSSFVVSTAKPQKTFSVGFENDGFDETVYAKELSEKLGIANQSRMISKEDFFDAIPAVQYHSDEPHANLSSVPLYYLSKLAAREVPVVLSGEGADELFAGYNEYEEPTLQRLYRALPMSLRRALYNKYKDKPHFSGKTIIMKYGQTVEERYIGQAKIMSDEQANALLKPPYKSSVKAIDLTAPYYKEVKNADDVTKRSYLDMHLWIVEDILLKADKMTMAHSLEGRTPLLDIGMWSLAREIPTNQKIKGNQGKYVFRRAAERSIPMDWAKRRKAGFLVPFVEWIKEEKYYLRVKEQFDQPYAAEFFDVAALHQLLEKHYAGISNEGRKIYTIYAFLVWYDQYFVSEVYRA